MAFLNLLLNAFVIATTHWVGTEQVILLDDELTTIQLIIALVVPTLVRQTPAIFRYGRCCSAHVANVLAYT